MDLQLVKIVIKNNNNVEVTHRSLFDNTIQGISYADGRVFSFQGHPEASPGPQDIQIYLINL